MTVLLCLKGHVLEAKTVAGSWLLSAKTCSTCGGALKAGMARYSCKPCGYHLCGPCYSKATQALMQQEINVFVYRPGQTGTLLSPGIEEDTLQVKVERGVCIGVLKDRIQELYGLPSHKQLLRRDVDSQPLANEEPLACEEGDVLHLTLAANLGAGMEGLVSVPDLADMVSGAIASATQLSNQMQESLQNQTYKLNMVLRRPSPHEDKRCCLEVVSGAGIRELLDMVKLELDLEDESVELEFAGNILQRSWSIYSSGLRDGDTVVVLVASKAN